MSSWRGPLRKWMILSDCYADNWFKWIPTSSKWIWTRQRTCRSLSSCQCNISRVRSLMWQRNSHKCNSRNSNSNSRSYKLLPTCTLTPSDHCSNHNIDHTFRYSPRHSVYLSKELISSLSHLVYTHITIVVALAICLKDLVQLIRLYQWIFTYKFISYYQ